MAMAMPRRTLPFGASVARPPPSLALADAQTYLGETHYYATLHQSFVGASSVRESDSVRNHEASFGGVQGKAMARAPA